MHTRLNPRAWSLSRQLFALQVVVVAVVVLAAGTAAYLQDRQRSQDSTSDRVLSIARSVAASPTVRSALTPPLVQPSEVLQPYAERVRRDTGTDFVVVMNTDRTRYSHPTAALIGKPFIGDTRAALAGGVVLETYTGTLGPSERAVVPVKADNGHVLGLVAVGVKQDALARVLSRQVPTLLAAALVALLLAAAGAALIARRLRRQTHGLGPDELSRMYEFYDAVLHAVHEGLLLLDLEPPIAAGLLSAVDVLSALLGAGVHRVANAARFCRASLRIILWVKVEDDRPFAQVILQLHRLHRGGETRCVVAEPWKRGFPVGGHG